MCILSESSDFYTTENNGVSTGTVYSTSLGDVLATS